MARQFHYVALDSLAKKSEGDIECSSKAEAIRHVQSLGLRPVSVVEAQGEKVEKISDQRVLLKPKQLISFTEELSELLEAGLPLEPALASMEARDESGELKMSSAQLRRYVTEGEQMYQALPKVSAQFDKLYCNLVKAGEASGSLQTILKQHGVYLKEQAELRARLTQALIYPSCLVLVSIIVSMVFIFYLLPQIMKLLEGMPGSEIPLGVMVMSGIGDLLRNHWLLIVGCFVSGAVLVKVWHQKEENKKQWDAVQLHIPIVGKVVEYGIYVQWLQTLGNLLSNGVPLVQGLELTSETVVNRHFKENLDEVTEKVRDGYRLTRCMRETKLFPANMIDLITVGESTGKLSRSLNRATEYYDAKLNVLIKSMLNLITPVVLLAMAVMVGVLAYTMIQAIYGTISHMGPQK